MRSSSGRGFSLTAASLPNVSIKPFHVQNEELPDLDASPSAWESMVGITAEDRPQFLLITDPFTIRSDNLLLGLDYAFRYSTKVGGMASGGQHPGANVLMLDGKAHRSGAVGMAFSRGRGYRYHRGAGVPAHRQADET